ncbi:MAG: hypothetical protein IKV25_04525 [Clostridia bacterium]|nr:hypothetical protein [Clostridia bacterium]
MKRVKIRFSSVTHALSAKEIISKNGGRVTMGKNTNYGKNEGCGYYLIIIGDVEKYTNLIKFNKIKVVGIDYL